MYVENKSLKMAVLAGATQAIKLMQKNPNYLEADILKEINKNLDKIVEKIDA